MCFEKKVINILEDDEIIIGINRKASPKKGNKKSKKKKAVKASSKKDSKAGKGSAIKTASKKNAKTRNIPIVAKVIFALILIVLLFIGASYVPLFNIKSIDVVGNNKISSDKIIELSRINDSINLFKLDKKQVSSSIMQNAYIESVEISRKFPNKVELNVVEREAKYMLQFADSYVYINNQGYMLEISNEKLNIPIIVGFTTDLSNIKAGNRINIDDLKKMNMVIKIYETAKTSGIGEFITKIDISNPKNYVLGLDGEGKMVYLGDCTDLNTRIIYLKAILDANKGKSGTIYLNVDLNTEKVYFRPSEVNS